jgi:hypothetical protein
MIDHVLEKCRRIVHDAPNRGSPLNQTLDKSLGGPSISGDFSAPGVQMPARARPDIPLVEIECARRRSAAGRSRRRSSATLIRRAQKTGCISTRG